MPDLFIGPRSYGRRRGRRLRQGRLALLDTLLPRIVISHLEEGVDPWALFPVKPRALWLEIGFGGGEHLVAQASHRPEVGFIGCEVFLNGIVSALTHIEVKGLPNVRLFPNDARLLLPALPEACLERVFLLFPDPWPKKRHTRRRFVAPANLDHLARLLDDGGELRIASDDVSYLRWTLGLIPVHPAFRWLVHTPEDWRRPPVDWVMTRYEVKALQAGRRPAYLRFERRLRRLSKRFDQETDGVILTP